MRVFGVGNGAQQIGTENTPAMRKQYTESLTAVRGMSPPDYFAWWNQQDFATQDQVLNPAEYEAMVRQYPGSVAFSRWVAQTNGANGMKTLLPLALVGLGVWWLFGRRR